MHPYGIVVLLLFYIHDAKSQCSEGRSVTFVRWSGVSPEGVPPVFVYSASGEEESLAGACLARCRELEDCAGVVVAYGRGNCHGVADAINTQLRVDNDVAFFKKICLDVAEECSIRWWALESTPGYHLLSEGGRLKVLYNTTMSQCYDAVLAPHGNRMYRSAQWVVPEGSFDAELVTTSDSMLGNCILNEENKFTEPESFRVSNYYTFYIENQCRHDYPKKIDRCSYEEYYNQTLRHVEYTIKNYTKDECKTACEISDRFVCRGFTWAAGRRVSGGGGRGLCDLHSEDLVTTGSWLLRRTAAATYYRRVICLNITVDCEGTGMIVTYRPRGVFRGRVYVPGRGDRCGARGSGSNVRLSLPLHGDCDVNFAYAISKGPNGFINRTMAYVMVMIQNNPIIQTAGDRWVRVGCSPGTPRTTTQVDATFAVRDVGTGYRQPSSMSENEIPLSVTPAAASAVYSASITPVTMYVVRARDDTGTGAVSLGEPLELRIETPVTDATEFTAYHLVASSRLGDSSVLLLDSRGCPTGQVDFPAFSRSWLGGTQRLSSRFKAFRFPTSHVVRLALTVKFCEDECPPVDCHGKNQGRSARQTNDTFYQWSDSESAASVQQDSRPKGYPSGVVAQGGAASCVPSTDDSQTLELEMVVDSKDMLSADTLVRADHQSTLPEDIRAADSTMVCVHELLLVSLALTWLAVQVLLLLGCCVLVKRYRNLAELSMQKDYHSFDNVCLEPGAGAGAGGASRRVHWPDQHVDILHAI